MPSLAPKLRKDLENAVKRARRVAEAGAVKALEQLAVGHHEPWGSMKDPALRRLRNRLRAHGQQLGDARDAQRGTQSITRLKGEVAYEHWHRMLFARYLAENDLLIEPESGQAMTMDECRELAREQGKDWLPLACGFAQQMLPEIFRQDDPVLEVALPPETRSELEDVLNELPREVFVASDSLGWVYQFWQADQKEAVNKSENKIGADELPAVTQLFTEDYMVDFLLDNTLGAWWAGKVLSANPALSANAQSEAELRQACALPGCPWTYLRFVRPASNPQPSTLNSQPSWQPAAGSFAGWPKVAKELTCLDPCMGSGHFVVAMFERLVALRIAEDGLDEKAAVSAVIRDNLFGLELDPRCTQIAAFNLALAAWRRVGHCALPPMNLACSGLAPNTSEANWVALAGSDLAAQNGMRQLHRLFKNAPVLGSLINPRAVRDELLDAAFHQLQPLLEKAVAQDAKDDAAHEMAVTACGLAKAAEILAGKFTLVATNVPFLGIRKQCEIIKEFVTTYFPDAKECLSTVFCARISHWLNDTTMVVVTPQNWLYQFRYRNHRKAVLENESIELIARLGEGGFESSQAAGAFAALSIITCSKPNSSSTIRFIDASEPRLPGEKATILGVGAIREVVQRSQLSNPDGRLSLERPNAGRLLNEFVITAQGIKTGDDNLWVRCFWEISPMERRWRAYQTSTETSNPYAGRSWIIDWRTEGEGMVRPRTDSPVVGKIGVAASAMREISVTIYSGDLHYSLATPLIPLDPAHLSAIWAFCSSPEYNKAVREIEQNIAVTTDTLAKVPFDLAHWQKVATDQYPQGLPKPFSSDPTQWLFNGHPCGSDQPLQVAAARFVGYQWPRQTGSNFTDCPALGPDGLEKLADKDGIVCLSATKGEAPAADRLNALLAAAFGAEWSAAKARELIAATGSSAKSLAEWLSDDFFAQHCELFHQRPFVWHIWDGLRGGFSALVNYHRLAAPDGAGQRTLEKLIYTYLGDWIDAQRKAMADGVEGADARLTAAEHLRTQLELILKGEKPFDLFVRWKPLHAQPIGWNPDINDGVRLNIRPFMTAKPLSARGKNACILRVPPKGIKWDKDRGKEPERPKADFPWFWSWDGAIDDFKGGATFDGNRWNDCHYTLATKQAARERQNPSNRL
jgi:hypothetical protein